jgi:hypothetical protein
MKLSPRKCVPFVLVMVMATSACRLDMHIQPRYNPLAKSDFFEDQRAARPLVDGTVARGDERADTYFYTGKIGSTPGEYMPFPVTKEVMDRGRERYNIYCSPCHSRMGDGNGIVPSRGFSKKPPSYHIDRLTKAPIGYFFDVMTNGYGIMQDYSAQVSPHEPERHHGRRSARASHSLEDFGVCRAGNGRNLAPSNADRIGASKIRERGI